jgi:hypothetical protein
MMMLLGVMVGVILTVGGLIVASYYVTNKAKKAAKAAEAEKKRNADAAVADLQTVLTQIQAMQQQGSLNDRLRRAMEITSRQSEIDLRGGEEQILLYNNLELEKLHLLKTILKEGHNPLITVRYATGDKRVSLSDYVTSIQNTLN